MGRPRKNTEAVVDKKAVRGRLKDKRLGGWQRQGLQGCNCRWTRTVRYPRSLRKWASTHGR